MVILGLTGLLRKTPARVRFSICLQPGNPRRKRLGLSPSVRRTSGPQHDLERGAATRGRAQPEAAADRRRPGAHVLQALTRGDRLLVEAGAVGHADDPLARALGDAHLRAAR